MATPSDRPAKLKGLPKVDPWTPPDWEPEDGYAIRAVLQGSASEEQQRRAMRFIVLNICGTDDLAYRPGPNSAMDTAFADGKRFVGLQIRKFLNINIPAVLGKVTEQGGKPAKPTEQPK